MEESNSKIADDEISYIKADFPFEKFFLSKEAYLIFVLLYVDKEKRAEFLGITEEMYEKLSEAKKWRGRMIKLLHSDRFKDLPSDEATAKVNEMYARMKKHAA
ncbi:hypothetical protein ACOTCR_20005 [Achromobacter xylosoxidans]